MSADGPVTVGEHYRWHPSTSEIEDIRNGARRSDSDYVVKLDVYEDRVRTWFLDVAVRETKGGASPSDYVALSVAVAYVEGVEQYRRGKSAPIGEAGDWFRASASRIFPNAPAGAISRLWSAVRCGLFHSGFTEGPTLLSHDYAEAVDVCGADLRINPARFVAGVLEDLSHYIMELRSAPDGEVAKHFVELWDRRWDET